MNERVDGNGGRLRFAHHLQADDAFGDIAFFIALFLGALLVGDGIERTARGTKEFLALGNRSG